MARFVLHAMIAASILLLTFGRACTDGPETKYQACIKKGLDYLAAQQQKDGCWTATGNQHRAALTSLSGMALLMEGSKSGEGKYAARVRKAVDWLVAQSQPNGLIGNRKTPGEGTGTCSVMATACYSWPAFARRKRTGSAGGKSRTCCPGPSASPPRPRPRPAAGAMSVQRKAMISTRAQPPSPRSNPYGPLASPASRFRRRPGERPRNTSRRAQPPTAESFTV